MSTVVYLLNISPTKEVKNKSPIEAWMEAKPSVKHLRIFGCIAYTLIPSQRLQKFNAKSGKCVLIGYNIESKAYKLFNPITKNVIVSRNVLFDEDASWTWVNGSETKIQAPTDDVHESGGTHLLSRPASCESR